uniref:Uncharacterized protein n=1 Tax=Anguilla anguilla TaxID=7936 RepID=A0A0E9W6F8_ANGAN
MRVRGEHCGRIYFGNVLLQVFTSKRHFCCITKFCTTAK